LNFNVYFLFFIFIFISCGVKKEPVAPVIETNDFINSFINKDITNEALLKKEKKKKATKEKSEE
jgi:hypothetical protein